jgi:FtsZ-binding cell division protein ZapB
VIDPLFWLGLSILLVAVSLTAVLVVAVPALQELARAARSAEKLFDTLRRDLPPTLDAIRLTGLEISDLTDDVSDGVKSASQVVKQVDQSLEQARNQAKNVQVSTRSVFTGVKTAWKSFTRPSYRRKDRLPNQTQAMQLPDVNREASLEDRRQAPQAYYVDDSEYESTPQRKRESTAWQNELDDFESTGSEDY